MGNQTETKGTIVNLNQNRLHELAQLTFKDIQSSMLLFNLIHKMNEDNVVKCNDKELVGFSENRLTLPEMEVTLKILEEHNYLTVDKSEEGYTVVLDKDFVFLSIYDSK